MNDARAAGLPIMVWALLTGATGGCRVEWGPTVNTDGRVSAGATGPVLIYTSMYRHVVEALEATLAEDLPALHPQWYQAGSEKVASRLDAELATGACPADVLVTSDPAHYARLKQENRLAPHVPVGALRVPRAMLDPDGAFVAVRVSSMVLAFRKDEPTPPRRWADLWSDRWAGESVVGDPLASGTYFTSLAILEHIQGPHFFPRLRAAQVVASGGNSAVQERLLSREKRVGMLLLENVLASQAKGEPMAYALPEDGVILVPGPAAILRTAPHPGGAVAFQEWLLTEKAQRIMADVGHMHAAREGVPPPKGAPPLADLLNRAVGLEGATWDRLRSQGAEIKARFGKAYGR
jgi:iron(III) transport system substrate-binding protein